MIRTRLLAFGAVALASLLLVASNGARAEDAAAFPSRTVKIIVAFPPGGATDIIARVIADGLQEAWKKPVIVENISGATGQTGTLRGSRADPDGYTITSVVGTTTSLMAAVRVKTMYDWSKDFEPLALVTSFPNILVVGPKLGVKTLKELIELVQKSPGKYTYASSGAGSSIQLAAEWFKLETKTDILHIPFTGSSPALPAMLGGQVDMMFDVMPSILPQVQNGNLIALGVGTLQRVPSAPDIPAIAETLPGFDVASWEGFMVPANTPKDIAQKISDGILAVMKDPAAIEKMSRVGALPLAKGPADFRAFMQADYAKWKHVSEATGIKIE